MARASRLTRPGREYLRGKRQRVTPRGRNRILPVEVERVLVRGQYLNEPESLIYHALVVLGVAFDAQVPLGPGRELGGALVDFILFDYQVAIEYNGPFHNTAEGQTKDFWRTVTRSNAGYRTVTLEIQDIQENGVYSLNKAIQSIMRKVGRLA